MPIPTVYGKLPFVSAEQSCVSAQFRRDNAMYGIVAQDNIIYVFLNSDRSAARAYFEGMPGFTSWTELDASTSMVAAAGIVIPGSVPSPGTNASCLTNTGTQLIVTLSASINGYAAGNHILIKSSPWTWIKQISDFQRILVRSDPTNTVNVRTVATINGPGVHTKELEGDPSSSNHPENNVCTGTGNSHNQYNAEGLGALQGYITIGMQS